MIALNVAFPMLFFFLAYTAQLTMIRKENNENFIDVNLSGYTVALICIGSEDQLLSREYHK